MKKGYTNLISYCLISGDSGECLPSKFQCEYNVCINSSLVCNGRDNCRPGKDEDHCKRPGPPGGHWPEEGENLDKLPDSKY